jgi:RNA recognition motif-containing protein
MATKLFVGGLSWDTKEDSLKNFFSQAGNVVSATVITDKFSGRSKGFGFVEMSSDQEAQEAIKKLNGQSLDGRNITVNEARPQQPRENNFRRG